MSDTDLHSLSVDQLNEAFRAKQLSPVEVTEAALARIDSYNDAVNAFVGMQGGVLAIWFTTPLEKLQQKCATEKDEHGQPKAYFAVIRETGPINSRNLTLYFPISNGRAVPVVLSGAFQRL